MSYQIEFKRSAAKEILKLPLGIQSLLKKHILELRNNPFAGNALKLRGKATLYRLRVGNYRLVYTVETTIKIITIVKVGHRKDIYKKL